MSNVGHRSRLNVKGGLIRHFFTAALWKFYSCMYLYTDNFKLQYTLITPFTHTIYLLLIQLIKLTEVILLRVIIHVLPKIKNARHRYT